MPRRFFRKKNSFAHETDDTWIEMNGNEFCKFVSSPEGKGRYFIELDEYVIEAPKEIYDEWHREKEWNRRQMKLKEAKGIETISFQGTNISRFGQGEDVTSDPMVDVEDDVICLTEIKRLRAALSQLDDSSRWLIKNLFLDRDCKSEREMARILGISQGALHKRKKKILKKLKFLVIKDIKNVQ